MDERALKALIERAKAIAGEMVYVEPLPCAGQRVIGGEHPAMAYKLTSRNFPAGRQSVRAAHISGESP